MIQSNTIKAMKFIFLFHEESLLGEPLRVDGSRWLYELTPEYEALLYLRNKIKFDTIPKEFLEEVGMISFDEYSVPIYGAACQLPQHLLSPKQIELLKNYGLV